MMAVRRSTRPSCSPSTWPSVADGTVYVPADGRIRKITPDGTITTVAGVEGEESFVPGGDGVVAVGEPLGGVGSIALAPDGSLVVSEQVGQIRRVTPAGVIELVAGTAEYDESAGLGDGGPATDAFLADNVGHRRRWRRHDLRGREQPSPSDHAGWHHRDPRRRRPAVVPTARRAPAARPSRPGLHPRRGGRRGGRLVYFADGGQVFRIGADGSFEHVAGRADGTGFDGDGGPAVDAGLQVISDLAVAPDGTLYILDSCNHRVRRVGADGVITTVAGSGPVCPEKEYGR